MDRAAIEAAGREMGIVPGDPAYPFVRFMIGMADAHAARLAQLLERIETMSDHQLAAITAFAAAAEKVAGRPLIATHQVQNNLLPPLLAAFERARVIITALLLIGAVGVGMGVQWWRTPALACDGATADGRRICYRFDGPPPAAPAPRAESQVPAVKVPPSVVIRQ